MERGALRIPRACPVRDRPGVLVRHVGAPDRELTVLVVVLGELGIRAGQCVVDDDRFHALEARSRQGELPGDVAVVRLPRPLLRFGGQRRGRADPPAGNLHAGGLAVDDELDGALRGLLIRAGDEPQRAGDAGASVHVVGERARHDRRSVTAHGAFGDRLARILARRDRERHARASELARKRESECLPSDRTVRYRPVHVDAHLFVLCHGPSAIHGRHGDRRRVDGRGIVVLGGGGRAGAGQRDRGRERGRSGGDDRGARAARSRVPVAFVQGRPQSSC